MSEIERSRVTLNHDPQLRIMIDDYEVWASVSVNIPIDASQANGVSTKPSEASLRFSSILLLDQKDHRFARTQPAFSKNADVKTLSNATMTFGNRELVSYGLSEALISCGSERFDDVAREKATLYFGLMIQSALERVPKQSWIHDVVIAVPYAAVPYKDESASVEVVQRQEENLKKILDDVRFALKLNSIQLQESHAEMLARQVGREQVRNGFVVLLWRNGVSIRIAEDTRPACFCGPSEEDVLLPTFSKVRAAFQEYRGEIRAYNSAVVFGAIAGTIVGQVYLNKEFALEPVDGDKSRIVGPFLKALSQDGRNRCDSPTTCGLDLLGWFVDYTALPDNSTDDRWRLRSLKIGDSSHFNDPLDNGEFRSFEAASPNADKNLRFAFTYGKELPGNEASFELPLDRYDPDTKYLFELERYFDGTFHMLMRAGTRAVAIKDTGNGGDDGVQIDLLPDRSYRMTFDKAHRSQAELRRKLRDVVQTGFVRFKS